MKKSVKRVVALGLTSVCLTALCASASADPLEDFWRTSRGREIRRLPVQVLPVNVLAQARVGLLNLVTRAQIECPVGLVFGHWRTMNWLDPAYRDDALGLAHGLGERGWYVDAYPSSELAAGTFTVDDDGFLRVRGQRYAALVLYRLGEGDAADLAKVVGARPLKTRLFTWDSPETAGAAHLASDRDIEPVVRALEQTGAIRQPPLSAVGLHGKGLDRLPDPDGSAMFADGTVVRVRGASPDQRGDVLDGFAQPLEIGGQKVFFAAEGVFAARLGKDGNLEALAAGGLRRVEAPGLSLALDNPEDVALVRRDGRWQGLWLTTRRLADLPAKTKLRLIVDAESDRPKGTSLAFRLQCFPRKEIGSNWITCEPGRVTRRYVLDFNRCSGKQPISLTPVSSPKETRLRLLRICVERTA